MKTNRVKQFMVALAASLLLPATTAGAQDASISNTVPVVISSAPAPQLPFGVPQILQLTQAKVGDEMIIAYIKNAGNSYGLSADQIIYLRQQGVSDAVVLAMLSQPKAALTTAQTSAPVPPPAVAPAYPVPLPTSPAPMPESDVQVIPDNADYYQPDYYPPVYYPSVYAWYPPVVIYSGRGGGWGGGFHGVTRGGGGGPIFRGGGTVRGGTGDRHR
jgi:hypothetical protein